MARILLVDDNAPLRAAMALGLARGGHSIQTAEDGAAGLRALAAEVFDVVVTDLLMPERDGLELIKEAHALQPQLRIIAISGGGRLRPDAYLPTAKLFGARRVLMKPFELDELMHAIADVLAS